jgi:hypothetical protein
MERELPEGEHVVLIIPGLGDQKKLHEIATKHFEKFGLTPIVESANWKGDENLSEKLARCSSLINLLHEKGNKIDILGGSAGGSLALLLFYLHHDKISKAVNLNGRLRKGNYKFRSLDFASRNSFSFKESVLAFEKIEPKLSNDERKRILTIRALIDEIVPAGTVGVSGATNINSFIPGHMLCIALSLLVFDRKIVEFIKGG